MDSECKKTKSFSLAILTIIISLLLSIMGCGPSYEERQAKKEAERKKLILENEEEEKRTIGQLANKYNAIYFPPKNLGSASFTYEFQEFFKAHSQEPLVFKGYLEDIERTNKGIIIDFLCLLGEDFFKQKAIYFRLTISESSVRQFLKRKQEDSMSYLLRYIYEPDYYVVARIERFESFRMYELDDTANGEEFEIESDVYFMSTGQFINAVAIQKDE